MRHRSVHSGHTNGFTLIELIVAVTVLGILAAIAIPNYYKFMAKSRQTEALTELSGIFASEVVFHGEFSRYGSFSEMGFTTGGSSTRYTYRSPAVGGNGGSAGIAGVDLLTPGIGASTPENTRVPSAASLLQPGTFTATATANLDGDPTIDQWHINDLKQGLGSADDNDVLF